MTPGLIDDKSMNSNVFHAKDVIDDNNDDEYQAVLAIRCLVCDICMQNGGGHAGSALGMAAIGVALWKHTMRYNPCDPSWFDRDRFILSNGIKTSKLLNEPS